MSKRKQYYQSSKASPTVVLTQSQLNRIKETVRKETIAEISKFDVEIMLTCFAMTLRRHYKFGYKRLFEMLEAVDTMFGQVLAGQLSDEEMRQQLEDECGIRIHYGEDK